MENDTLKEEIKHLKATKLKSCEKCNETFATDVNLKDSVDTKDRKVIIQVEPGLENKTETKQADESDHLFSIEKSFKCERCSKILRSESSLQEHKYRHCVVCGKLFQNIIQLKSTADLAIDHLRKSIEVQLFLLSYTACNLRTMTTICANKLQ